MANQVIPDRFVKGSRFHADLHFNGDGVLLSILPGIMHDPIRTMLPLIGIRHQHTIVRLFLLEQLVPLCAPESLALPFVLQILLVPLKIGYAPGPRSPPTLSKNPGNNASAAY